MKFCHINCHINFFEAQCTAHNRSASDALNCVPSIVGTNRNVLRTSP